MSDKKTSNTLFSQRFRGYFPVVVDVETAGFNHQTDALLEVAATLLVMDEESGILRPGQSISFNIEPFPGANLEQASLEFTGIDPFHPLRGAVKEDHALKETFKLIRKAQKAAGCHRSILVGHNAGFDHRFMMAATERNNIKRCPFHPFSTFDTSSLSALAVGQTVLAKACQAAGIPFDNKEAHSALYDCQRTADLFCWIVNRYRNLGGWPLPAADSDTASVTDTGAE